MADLGLETPGIDEANESGTSLAGKLKRDMTKLNAINIDATQLSSDAAQVAADKVVVGQDRGLAETARTGAETAESNAVAVVSGGTASLTPEAGKIPMADASGEVAWWIQKGLFGKVASPLTHVPMMRDNDAISMSGLPTFNRTSAATYIDPLTLLLKTAAIGEQRFERSFDGTVKCLLEGLSTNSFSQTEDLTHGDWAGASATVAAEAIDNPAGVSGCFSIKGTGVSLFPSISQVDGVIGTYESVSVFAKELDAPDFYLQVGDATNGTNARIKFAWVSGILVPSAGTETLGSIEGRVEQLAGGWWRAKISVIPLVTGGTRQGSIFTRINTLDTLGTYFDKPQFEQTHKVTSYISSIASPTTRVADTFWVPSAGNAIKSNLPHSMYVEFDWESRNIGKQQGILSFTNEVNRKLVAGNGNNTATVWNGVVTGGSGATLLTEGSHSMGYSYDGTTMSFFVNNRILMTYDDVGSTVEALYIKLGGIFYFGHIGNFKFFDRALTESEIGAL